jgi:short-subunit dehydrogenase
MSLIRMQKMTKLFSSVIMTSEAVAKIAYDGWMKNKSVIIPGPLNVFLALFARVTPRAVTSRIVKGINKA